MLERPERHPEHTRVELACTVESRGGLMPAGSKGTVVHVYPDEAAYLVEFSEPFHTITTVEPQNIVE
jgi:hypothetical protein